MLNEIRNLVATAKALGVSLSNCEVSLDDYKKLRAELRKEFELDREQSVDGFLPHQISIDGMIVSPSDSGRRFYARYLSYLTKEEFEQLEGFRKAYNEEFRKTLFGDGSGILSGFEKENGDD